VKSLMRADLARQMAAGDWAEALAPADSLINSWFSARGVTPVWHMDGAAGLDEVQTVTITGTPTGGTFTLTFSGQTTAAIAYNATAATVEAALAALNNIRDEDITVTGGPGPGTAYTVTFDGGWGGAFDGANVAAMTATGSFTGGSTPAVAVTTATGGGGALTVSGCHHRRRRPTPTPPRRGTIPGFPDQIDSCSTPPGRGCSSTAANSTWAWSATPPSTPATGTASSWRPSRVRVPRHRVPAAGHDGAAHRSDRRAPRTCPRSPTDPPGQRKV
jgi:hypothetical protein